MYIVYPTAIYSELFSAASMLQPVSCSFLEWLRRAVSLFGYASQAIHLLHRRGPSEIRLDNKKNISSLLCQLCILLSNILIQRREHSPFSTLTTQSNFFDRLVELSADGFYLT
jgi:hypothetical protein